jgi:hypothetical protein
MNLRVLGLDPTIRGFAYAVFEGPERLLDWGLRHVPQPRNRESVSRIRKLIDIYQPSVIAIEEMGRSQKRSRARDLAASVEGMAEGLGITCRRVAPREVSLLLLGYPGTKYARAVMLAERFPELAHRLPRFRKPWMSEDERINLFDAAGFGLVAAQLRLESGVANLASRD